MEALSLRRRLGDAWGIANSLSDLGHLEHDQGNDAEARACYQESLALRRELGDAWGLMMSTFRLANLHIAAGEFAAARDLVEECFSLAHRVAPSVENTFVLVLRGVVACEEGDYGTARRLLAAALDETHRRKRALGPVLRGFARLAAAQHQWGRALRLAGAAAGDERVQRSSRQIPGRQLFGPADQAVLDRLLAPGWKALGEEAAQAAWREGQGWSVEEAVAYARAADQPIPPAPGAGISSVDAGPLSVREREVAALVAQGLTNPQIAARLIISERTAARHVEHILGKLGFAGRTQIAAWAAQHRLAERGPPPTR